MFGKCMGNIVPTSKSNKIEPWTPSLTPPKGKIIIIIIITTKTTTMGPPGCMLRAVSLVA
jgi:hypothetical protein